MLKRLFKKKSYILMLLLVPLMVFLLRFIGEDNGGIMTVGICIMGDDASSIIFRASIPEETSPIHYEFYESKESLIEAVENNTVDEAWIVPKNLDGIVETVAKNEIPLESVEIVVRENGLSHLLGREILCSKIYPSVAKQLLINYMNARVYGGNMTEQQQAELMEAFDSFALSESLFNAGYVDASEVEDTSIILMPLRGILALWLMLCGIATSMYYLEDQENGLFIWWHIRAIFIRELGYYLVAFIAPSVVVLISLAYSESFTTVSRELPALFLYILATIILSIILRLVVPDKKHIGILIPALIILNSLLSPVFIDFKELRQIQKCCPAFHYLSSIHDIYYLKTLFVYTVLLGGLAVLLFKLPVKMRQVFKAHLL
ncbi:ABC transporter permease [Pseudobutyrivibrio xylanivorans]|uniref:ABC transporter permease n=1 Tax=Pseudobutyrivibrio xylanivorans TaxID=185007 RepID=UPI00142EB3AD|nr:ABC transporter permease [Pseudobutyrivibrio xylanivorans]